MSTTGIADLESALMARARKLAEEYLDHAQRSRDRTLTEAAERLRLREEREILAAKALADRTYRQRVQAAESAQLAVLDRLRWDLVLDVMRALDDELAHLVADRPRYEALLRRYLAHAAESIERDDLVAMLNPQDRTALGARWNAFLAGATRKRVTLADETLNVRGGIVVRSIDDDIRVDHTFEGRRERLAEDIEAAILTRLFSAAEHTGGLNAR